MRTRHWIIIASATLALIAVLALPSLTLARGPNGGPGQQGGGGMMGGAQQSLVAVAAQVLGVPQADLIAQLQSGKTIKDVADDKAGAIVEAFVKTRAERMATQVTSGRLTQAQADQMLATMRANVTAQLSAPWTARGQNGGTGYVDADGDGTCDNAGTGMGRSTGMGMGHGRMGMGRNGQ